MAWIESHQALREHPKVIDLGAAMGWNLDVTIGKLHRFWWWCVDYAEDGDLRRHSDARLAAAVGLELAEAPKFVAAMLAASWIDRRPYRRVHDWWDYISKWLQAKYKRSPGKWQRVRDLYVHGTSPVRNPIPTNQPTNRTNHTKPTNPHQQPAAFEEFWNTYPRKVGKAEAWKAWQRIKPEAPRVAWILSAVAREKRSQEWQRDLGRYVPHPSTWLNQRRWEDSPEPREAPGPAATGVQAKLRDLTAGIGSGPATAEAPR